MEITIEGNWSQRKSCKLGAWRGQNDGGDTSTISKEPRQEKRKKKTEGVAERMWETID